MSRALFDSRAILSVAALIAALLGTACSDSTAPSTGEDGASSPKAQLAGAALDQASLVTASSGYSYLESDQLEVRSTNGIAKAAGSVNWFYGTANGAVHRGNYTSGSRVYALSPVGCIWTRVVFEYLTGSVSAGVGGAQGSVAIAGVTGRYYYRCRSSGQSYPAALTLAGIGYAKYLLNSTTLEVCTSRTAAEGPRYCAWEKNTYGGQ